MGGPPLSLPAKWTQFLKYLADEHETNLNNVVSELCEWTLSDDEDKGQFKIWLDEAYPPEEEGEEEARATEEEAAEEEEENEEESEEESHEHRD